jgi:glycosyltransferase involved in cell wall biosynthesis
MWFRKVCKHFRPEKRQETRILIFIWNLGVGGVQKRMKDVLRQINAEHKNVKVHVLVKFKKPRFYNCQISQLENVTVHYAPVKGSREQGRLAFIGQFFFILWVWLKFLIILPHTVLSFMNRLSAIMVGINKLTFFWQARLVINEGVFTPDYLKIHSVYPELAHKTLNYFYKHADKIIVPTQVIKDEFVNSYRLDQDKIKIIPNWTMFEPRTVEDKIYDLIYAGRLAKEKQLLSLLDLIAELRKELSDLTVLFLGQGDLKDGLLKKIEQLDLEATVELKQAKQNVQDYLLKSKVFVLNSKNEGLPNAVIEAGMCAVPSVVNNFVGSDEVVIHEKTGFIANNPQEMKKYLKLLLQNKDKRFEFGQAMQQHVIKNFSASQQVRFIKQLLD